MSTISFTIITCTYNAEATIGRTLQSVMSQQWHAVEHLIVDGRSTDGTMTLVEEYRRENAARDNGHRVTVVSEPDKGLYDAMNKALLMATGDFVEFLNAGDTFADSTSLTTMAGLIDRQGSPNVGIAYADTAIVDDAGAVLRLRCHQPPVHATWRSFLGGMKICHQAFFARRDLASQTPYDLSFRFSADYDWCIRLMKLCDDRSLAIVGTPQVAIHYLDGGMTNRNHRASLQERFRLMKRHYGALAAIGAHLWFVARAALFPKKWRY